MKKFVFQEEVQWINMDRLFAGQCCKWTCLVKWLNNHVYDRWELRHGWHHPYESGINIRPGHNEYIYISKNSKREESKLVCKSLLHRIIRFFIAQHRTIRYICPLNGAPGPSVSYRVTSQTICCWPHHIHVVTTKQPILPDTASLNKTTTKQAGWSAQCPLVKHFYTDNKENRKATRCKTEKRQWVKKRRIK
jgi:hypothetical protein